MSAGLVAASVLCGVGVFFGAAGALGIVRLPDVYSRIQSASMTITLGALPALIGLAVAAGPITAYGGRALIVAFLMLVLGPTAAHALARAAYKTGIPMWSGSVADQPHEATASGDGSGEGGAQPAAGSTGGRGQR